MCASFQRVDPAPVLLPERFRGGCAFGDRKSILSRSKINVSDLVRIKPVDKSADVAPAAL